MSLIKTASHDDLRSIAQCHRKAFPKALSSAMGVNYLCKMLEWYITDERSFLFFIEENGVCCGYCGGLKFDGGGRSGSASSMIQYSFREAVKTFLSRPWLLLHPEFVPKYKLAARNVFKRIRKIVDRSSERSSVTQNNSVSGSHMGLIVIGVDPAFQGKGYGSQLLRQFEAVSISHGYLNLSLTVRTDNLQAIRTYTRNGWGITDVNGKSTTMKKRLRITTSHENTI